MKKSFHIFQRDLSRLLHNKAAILVLIGVCLLPSLYAWFNIAANLDPYGNTSKIKVAIACLDKEASSENLSIIITMEIRLVQRFLQLKTFTANCRKAWKLSTPALPDMARR